MLKRVKDLVAGDCYDALPLCEKCLKPYGTDMDDDSVWVAAENLYFDVESIEKMGNGDYAIFGEPYNMTADGEEVVAIDATSKRIEIPCAFGTLVAEQAGDPGIYDEIEIDLIGHDGRMMQLVVVGTSTYDTDADGNPELHTYVWDGSDESANIIVYPDMETAVWY